MIGLGMTMQENQPAAQIAAKHNIFPRGWNYNRLPMLVTIIITIITNAGYQCRYYERGLDDLWVAGKTWLSKRISTIWLYILISSN